MNQMAASFGDFFFGNVFITPNNADVGAAAPGDYIDFEVWHSFTDVKTLAGVSETGGDEVELVGKTSGTLYSFNSLSYRVFLNQSSGGVIDYQAFFDLGADGVFPFSLTASVAMELPELIDWSSPPVMLIQYFTEVIESFGGAEQRIALRDKPRLSVSYQYALADQERYRFDYKLMNFGGDVIAPIWPMQVYASADIYAGDTYVDLAAVNGSINSATMLLATDGTDYEILSVSLISGTRALLKRLVKKNLKGARLVPCFIGSHQDQSGTTTYSNFLDFSTQSFDLDPELLIRPEPINDFERLDGTLILPFKPDRSQDVTRQNNRLREILDPGLGAKHTYIRTPGVVRIFSNGYRFFSENERQRFEDFVELNHGSQGEFWFEGPDVALEISKNIYLETQVLTIKSSGYFQFYKSRSFAPGLAVRLYNGTTLYRKILSASKKSDDSEILILNEPVISLLTKDVDYVAPLYLGRFDTDDFRYTFQTTSDSTITKTIKQLLYADPEKA